MISSIFFGLALVLCFWNSRKALRFWESWSAAYFELWQSSDLCRGKEVYDKYFDEKGQPKVSLKEIEKIKVERMKRPKEWGRKSEVP